ncbi:hypothetical protein RF11_15264 [Thelohanellus kitauei]|uniref:Uncharacterized protein n=1 Tax=Thelohanellus kitauei TaxID=669202 RepID=A0A0C2MI68_THEKT|nr:hypothetical protein RF11_15264 [Thelohanellus kitauei]
MDDTAPLRIRKAVMFYLFFFTCIYGFRMLGEGQGKLQFTWLFEDNISVNVVEKISPTNFGNEIGQPKGITITILMNGLQFFIGGILVVFAHVLNLLVKDSENNILLDSLHDFD